MGMDRRVSAESRRRLVIYQTGRDVPTGTAADRRAAEKLREARRPTASYGSHVNRRLRGRWFSLVPVRRRTVALYGVAILGSAILLSLLHWASVTWPSLANNAELSRPLRLDRPDSFGAWARTFFLAASAATALLVYQLRRYKVDDYQGHYRIWRPVIFLFAILSIDSICDLVPWAGAMIDATLGKRVALAGADWIRIVLTVGGAVLAIRLLVEVHRSKLAFLMMLLAVVSFAIPLMSHWNLFEATTMPGWIAVTTAPLIASAALWISVGGYLRMLFREVRGLDQERVVAPELAVRKSKAAEREQAESDEPRGWFGRRSKAIEEREEPKAKSTERAPRTERKPKNRDDDAGAAEVAPKRSWASRFSLGRSKVAKKSEAVAPDSQKPIPVPVPVLAAKPPTVVKPVATEKVVAEKSVPEKATAKVAKTETEAKPKRSWFSWGRAKAMPTGTESEPAQKLVAAKPQPAKPTTEAVPGPKPATAPEPAKPERKGLGGWLRRDSSAAKPAATDEKQVVPRPATVSAANKTDDADGDDDDVDDGSVDWGAMNKSERRRMRKEIKRGGRAA